MNPYASIITCLTIVLFAIIGGIIPLFYASKPGRLRHFLGFSAGVLLGAAFFHLLPESMEKIGSLSSYTLLAGLLTLFILEKFVAIHACEILDCESHTMGAAAFVGFSVHNLIDGIALGVSWSVPSLAPAVVFAISAHKVPSSMALSSILIAEKYSPKTVIVLTLIFAAMIPIGAVLASFFVGIGSPSLLGFALAFSAGTFLHIAISDVLPEVHRADGLRYPTLVALIIGLGSMLVV